MPLHWASWNGHLKVVQLLLEEVADIKAADKDGRTPLYSALWNGHLEIVQLLLEKGADVNAADKNGSTPLHRASESGHLEIVRLLLKEGADVKAANEGGSTPLHRASIQKSVNGGVGSLRTQAIIEIVINALYGYNDWFKRWRLLPVL